MHNASLQLAPHDLVPGTQPLLGGETAVTLTSAATLQALGIGVAPLGTAGLDVSGSLPVAEFPITGGTSGPGADAVILHQGSGLLFTAGHGAVALQDFRVDTVNGVIDANVTINGWQAGNAAVFDLGSDAGTLTLTGFAADVLKYTLGSDAITPEVIIGSAAPMPSLDIGDVILSPDADTRPFIGGETGVSLTSAGILSSLGVQVAPLGSASLDLSGAVPVAEFPITGGTAGPGADAVILHQGSGLELSASGTRLELRDFLIDTRNGIVTANVEVNDASAGNVAVFSLGADGATLGLTEAAAGVLDDVFGTMAFTPSLQIGIAAPSPETLDVAIDWNLLASQAEANFAATGYWFV